MRIRAVMVILVLVLGGIPGCRQAAPLVENPIKARLVLESSVIAAGEPFRVGVYFEIPAGWHLYWKEPGDIGLPTEVSLVAPEGFAVGELQWPKHKEFVQGGGLKGLGYAGEVLLFAEIKPPPHLKPGERVPLRAKAKWLACGPNICIPDERDFSAEVRTGEKSTREQEPLFQAWAKR